MAQPRSSGGCAGMVFVLMLFLIGLGLAVWALAMTGMLMAAPVVVPYLALTDPAQLAPHSAFWLWGIAAAAVVSYLLPSPSVWAKQVLDEPADRRARHTRQALQACLLLVAPGLGGLVFARVVSHTATGHLGDSIAVAGWSLTTTVVVTAGCSLWNRRFPAVGRMATAEEVWSAVESADRQLREVRAQGAAVHDMLLTVERQIAAAHRQVRFADLRSTHYTSFRCADIAYVNYQSVRASTDMLSRLATRARASAAPRIVPRRHQVDRTKLRESEATLRAAAGALNTEVHHRLDEVSLLNQRTADLRDTIRDTCGHPGRRWYGDLVERRERARVSEA